MRPMPSSGSSPATAATWSARTPTLRNQIHAELDALLPGLSAAVGNIFDHEPVLVIARHLGSAQAIRARGLDGLAALLQAEGLRYQRRSLEKVLAWAEQAHEPDQNAVVHKRIFAFLDDERRARLRSIRALESDLAALLVRTPYVLLLSFPGINVVSAAEFAGEMGPIRNSPATTPSPAGRGYTRRGTRAIRWTTPARWWAAPIARYGTCSC